MNSKDLFCRELPINSAELKIPRTTYQRELNEDRVRSRLPVHPVPDLLEQDEGGADAGQPLRAPGLPVVHIEAHGLRCFQERHRDERIANEPKVSCRDGRYYVFDGQHTIAARKLLNGGRDLPIRCKVFYGLTESDEALLFAQQTGASASLTAGAKFRALVYGGDSSRQKRSLLFILCVLLRCLRYTASFSA